MLLELAIGDAYGASFEYCDENLQFNNPQIGYIQNTKHLNLKPGKYTDDTQMSIAIAELMISNKFGIDGSEISLRDVAAAFLETFHRDQRPGYSRNFQKFLERTKTPDKFLADIRSDSDKSGAAMRSCPIGYIKDPLQVLKFAKLQASLTHNTDIGIRSSQIIALSCNFFLYQDTRPSRLSKFLKQYVSLDGFNFNWNDPVGGKGNQAVSAALTAIMDSLLESENLNDLLKNCVSYGGDCDTVATIALGIASCCATSSIFLNDLPDVLIWGLEPGGKWGKDYLEQLDLKLENKFSKFDPGSKQSREYPYI